jgi:hypothetical protein
MILDKINLVAGAMSGAIVAAGLYSVVNTVWLLPAARDEGRMQLRAEQAQADLDAEQQRKKEDAKLQRMSDYDLCVRNVGRVPECNVFLRTIRSK